MTAYLRQVKADVVFAFFGYNESFDGKPDDYQKQLARVREARRAARSRTARASRASCSSARSRTRTRTIPTCPTARRTTCSSRPTPRRPKPRRRKRASRSSICSIRRWSCFKARRSPLTINGVHLSEEGNRQLAEVIAQAVARQAGQHVPPRWSRCARRCSTRTLHWWNRYRASDGNDVWGSRSTLKFVNGQSNADVLQPELVDARRDDGQPRRARLGACRRQGQGGGRQQRAQARAGRSRMSAAAARAPAR